MAQIVYVEQAALAHPRTQSILERTKHRHVEVIERYSEVFNSRAHSFRAQKQAPALILALKENTFVHETPSQYETGGGAHYYFSHMLNCVYDCRYCFLQGMFRSAHYLVFVNYEDFAAQLSETATQHADAAKPTWFFSGYDCDSLAFEPMTGFADYFVDVIQTLPNAVLELRTKSTQIRPLLKREATPQVVVAASLSPEGVVSAVEHGTPSLVKRLRALKQLQEAGWRIGIRFDPVLWHSAYQDRYRELVEHTFTELCPDQIDSVTIGGFRVPKDFYKTMRSLYPDEPLLTIGLKTDKPMVRYPAQVEQAVVHYLRDLCLQWVDQERVFAYLGETLSSP